MSHQPEPDACCLHSAMQDTGLLVRTLHLWFWLSLQPLGLPIGFFQLQDREIAAGGRKAGQKADSDTRNQVT